MSVCKCLIAPWHKLCAQSIAILTWYVDWWSVETKTEKNQCELIHRNARASAWISLSLTLTANTINRILWPLTLTKAQMCKQKIHILNRLKSKLTEHGVYLICTRHVFCNMCVCVCESGDFDRSHCRIQCDALSYRKRFNDCLNWVNVFKMFKINRFYCKMNRPNERTLHTLVVR